MIRTLNRYSFLLLISLFIGTSAFGQKHKPFIGKLEYKISMRDTNMQKLIPDNQMVVYTNDTITRIENYTAQLGKQVVIRHMSLNKSYILIDSPIGKYAIQIDNSNDTVSKPSRYHLEKKCFKRRILKRRAKRLKVTHEFFEEPEEFLYLKNFSNKYLNNFEDSPGLLAKYSLATTDGVMDYELSEIKEYTPDRDLFGIPSDYEKVTMDEFMDKMIGPQGPPPEEIIEEN
jgi:hypothetical protein